LFAVAKQRLPKVLETKLSSFPAAIIDVHGKDLTVSVDPSRSGTPAPGTSTSAPVTATSSSSTPVAKPKARVKNVNIATVVVEADFQASADDLFGLLTDPKRIPSWTRAPAEV
jgi:activator of HSP90 ATPase